MQALAGSPGTESEVFFLFFLIFSNFFPIWRPRFSNYPYLGAASDSARASILRRAIKTSPAGAASDSAPRVCACLHIAQGYQNLPRGHARRQKENRRREPKRLGIFGTRYYILVVPYIYGSRPGYSRMTPLHWQIFMLPLVRHY